MNDLSNSAMMQPFQASYNMDNLLDLDQAQPLQASGASGSVPFRGYATRAGWHKNQDTIKRLYVDENKTLKEVMTIMERDHGHRGT